MKKVVKEWLGLENNYPSHYFIQLGLVVLKSKIRKFWLYSNLVGTINNIY